MGATAFLSSWPGCLLMAVVLRCVAWKPIREFINEWRLYKRQQKYPHIVVCRTATPKRERKRLQQQHHRQQANETDMVALFKGTMDRCFSTVAKVTIEVLTFLCCQVIDGVTAVVAMFASLLPSKEKEDESGDVRVESFSPTSTSSDPVRQEATRATRKTAPELKMNETRESTRGSSYPMQRETLQESPAALRGEQIGDEGEEIQPIQQEPRRVRKLDPSQRLRRRIPIQTPGRRSNVAQIQTSQPQPSPRVQVTRPRPQQSLIQWQQAASPGSSFQLTVRAEPVDTSALSEQMNKRRVNGEELSLGNPGGKKRRVAYGRTPLQGCAPHPISRAGLSKRVRVEREERILESMSRKRVKPNPEPAKTQTASTAAAPGLFGAKTPAAAAPTTGKSDGVNTTAPNFGSLPKQPTAATPAAGPFTFGSNGASNSTSTPPADATQTPAKKDETPTPKTDNKTKPAFAPNLAPPFGGTQTSTSTTARQQQSQQPPVFGGASASGTSAAGDQQQPTQKPVVFGAPADQSKPAFGNASGGTQTSTTPAPATATPQPGFSQTPNFNAGSTTQNPPPAPAATPNFNAATSRATASNTAPMFGGSNTATPNGSGPFTTPAPAAAQAPAQNGAPAAPFGFQATSRNDGAHPQFGSQTQNGSAPAPATPFGSQNGFTPAPQAGASNPFGGTPAPNAAAPAPQASNPFGGTPAQQGTAPAFGASAQGAPAPATQFGAANPFGGAPAQQGASQFGGAPAQGATTSFGASAQSAPAPATQFGAANPFGGAPGQQGASQFGATPTQSTPAPAAQFGAANPFGATPAQQGATSTFGTPAGAMKTPQANGFGEQKENANPFGAPGGSAGFQQAAAAPGFGGAGAPKTPASNGFGATNSAPAFPAAGGGFSVGSSTFGAKPRRSRPRVAGRGRVGGRR